MTWVVAIVICPVDSIIYRAKDFHSFGRFLSGNPAFIPQIMLPVLRSMPLCLFSFVDRSLLMAFMR